MDTIAPSANARVAPSDAEMHGRLFEALLDQLHLDFPGATTPGKQCLHVMLYNRNKEEGAPIDKVTIKITLLPEGGAKLMLQKKAKKAKKPVPAKPKLPVAGKFTAMVSSKRSKKKS